MKNLYDPGITSLSISFSSARSLIETVNDQLKNISQIEHSRHRSV